ncbi:uncharacterized protein LOC130721872 [Lotus japonicus]|uniref:uncharacterized protein LOC130721872 n=1 Tax=Lotus japonicus TaxID=34305 RepID=UPI002584C30E|nr:uncharacterized protein LOC130721872 [Lotus japonicus]
MVVWVLPRRRFLATGGVDDVKVAKQSSVRPHLQIAELKAAKQSCCAGNTFKPLCLSLFCFCGIKIWLGRAVCVLVICKTAIQALLAICLCKKIFFQQWFL